MQRATVTRGGRAPVLAAVAATEDVAALIYMEQLLKQAATAGFAVKKISLSATASEGEITTALARLSADADVAGIILNHHSLKEWTEPASSLGLLRRKTLMGSRLLALRV